YPLRGRQGDIPPPARLFNRKTGVPPATAARTPCSSCKNLFARPEKSRKILPLVFEYSNTFGSIPAQGLLLAAGRQSFFTPPLSRRPFFFVLNCTKSVVSAGSADPTLQGRTRTHPGAKHLAHQTSPPRPTRNRRPDSTPIKPVLSSRND